MPADGFPEPPLARWADRRLAQLARDSGSAGIAALSGAAVMRERAAANRLVVPGPASAGGGCRLLRARGDWIALNLSRPDDRATLPALFGDAALDEGDDAAIAAGVARSDSLPLLAHGRTLGLAIAAVGERAAAPALDVLARGPWRDTASRRPIVLDLSALWAGPLAGRLLRLAGAEVVKVENPRRPDAMRTGDPALFARLDHGKTPASIDFIAAAGRADLLALIARADIVIEAARPRALAQAGIDADALVAARPGLIWLTITGHGARAPQADWVGFGDDAAVAGGLSAALVEAGGAIGFGGDAPADPLTGIVAALAGWRAWRRGNARRIGLSMSGVVAAALAEERRADPAALTAVLQNWSRSRGKPMSAPGLPPIAPAGPAPPRCFPCARGDKSRENTDSGSGCDWPC